MGETHGLEQIRRALADDARLVERVTGTESSWEGRIFTAERIEVELADGTRSWREVVRHHGGAGVLAALEGRVCLVRQYRVALGHTTLEIPAGKVDPGEDRATCAARELTEETGLVAKRLELLVESYGAPGFTNEHTSVYFAHGLSQGPASPDDGELVDVLWVPADDVLAAIRAGLIDDAKTVEGVLAARAYGLL
ncbi:MAG TPA: NUDIX hydrolase [Candidatus Olsenella pullistercoris]|uniref:NUDIX hydrolase n=1 Tax=Candidatus Olsenella pullistercoris TaxID=2838712 RepID=A0A9D2EZ38_9ACTN|nr:NUDIX hydrolase [Candidatus Olsenella pullistercoris]